MPMFPYQKFKSSLTLPKIIGGISKTLAIANQLIPLYKQTMPMIKNAQSIIQKVNLSSKKAINNSTIPTKKAEANSSQPQFFL